MMTNYIKVYYAIRYNKKYPFHILSNQEFDDIWNLIGPLDFFDENMGIIIKFIEKAVEK